jgi:hypothetical protein
MLMGMGSPRFLKTDSLSYLHIEVVLSGENNGLE